MLEKTISILAATTPPLAKFASIGDAAARISELETQLGVKHGLPIFNMSKAAHRVAHLETLLAQKTASVPASAPAIPTAKADDGILKTTFAEFRAMDAATRLQFAQDGGQLTKADFDRLTPAAKMEFCKAGGKVDALRLKSYATSATF